jgi:ketosteroid isomerase-like protein
MPTGDEVVVIRRFCAPVAAGDLTAVGRCFRADAVWRLPGARPIASTHTSQLSNRAC